MVFDEENANDDDVFPEEEEDDEWHEYGEEKKIEETQKGSTQFFFEPFTPSTLRRRNFVRREVDENVHRSSIAGYRVQEELDRIPKNEKGEIEQKDLELFAERLLRHKDTAKLQRKFSLYSLFAWIVIMLVILGVVVLAIQLSKDTTVSKDGDLIATNKLGTAVMVKANSGMHIHADTSPLSSIPLRHFRRSLRRMLTPKSEGNDYIDYDTVALVSKDQVDEAYGAVTNHDTAIHVGKF